MEKARNHQSVDWYAYFKSIRSECPWSYAAYIKGKIHIVEYQGQPLPMGDYEARMYVLNVPDDTVIALATGFNHTDAVNEWLWSFPHNGAYATPVPVLIQQPRAKLQELRNQVHTVPDQH